MKKLINYLIWIIKRKTIRPPQLYKEKLIREYGRAYCISHLIETGTYEGDTINALKKDFTTIESIELDKILVKKASERFNSDINVFIYQGDSPKVLKDTILSELQGSAIFWLDAHYSGGKTADKGNPILGELKSILANSKQHIILIDDADYNWTKIKRIKKMIGNDYKYEIKHNIIRLVPK